MPFSAPTPHSGRDLPDEEVKLIHALVWDFLDQNPLWDGQGKEDLIQECVVHWWHRRALYQEDRASRNTFLRQVVRNKLEDIRRHTHAARRHQDGGTPSLDILVNPTDPDHGTLAERIADPEDAYGRVESRELLRVAFARLTARERKVLAGLQADQPKAEIARALGISRDTVYQDIARIKKVMKDVGLRE